jgi:Asp-tRNA(Asn)/Glu-tRNA(Gln) amidotransferase A subunit family amidase
MRTLDCLLHAALAVLKTGEWPDARAESPKADVESVFRACVSALEAHGCRVEVSPWPSWDQDGQPFPGQEERSGGEFDREHGVWVNCRLGPQAGAVAINMRRPTSSMRGKAAERLWLTLPGLWPVLSWVF